MYIQAKSEKKDGVKYISKQTPVYFCLRTGSLVLLMLYIVEYYYEIYLT